MKKYFTGIICVAAILAASVVLLPAAALMIAVQLSKHRDDSRKYSPHAEGFEAIPRSQTLYPEP
jgi:hypothetical protein